jgi:general secretion pathway protein A
MYTAYFGFHENPFYVTPNPHCFYSTPLYQAAYTRLLAGIHERKGLLLLTGEVGSGKTTLLRKLMTECKTTASCAFLYNPAFTFDDLLSMIYEEFNLPEKGERRRQQRIQDLHKFLLAQWQAGRLVALFIDEAQKLEDEAVDNLQLLLGFKIADTPLLQLVLVGPPELRRGLLSRDSAASQRALLSIASCPL